MERNFIKKIFSFIGFSSKKEISIISKGLKNASFLTIGTIFSQVISLIGFIYIARLLGPSDYGIYTTVGAFVGLFSIMTFSGINRVVLREGTKDIKQMSIYLNKTVTIKILFSIIAIIVCLIASFFTTYSTQIRLYIVLCSFLLIFTSLKGFFDTVYKAAEKMQYIAVLDILNRTLFVFGSVIFLYIGFGITALFIIALISNFFSLLLSYKLTKKFVRFKFWKKIEWDINLLKPALIFSIIYFTGMLATKIDLVMISLLSTTRDVGIYGVVLNIVNSGLVLRNIIATAFFPIFVKTFHRNKINHRKFFKYSIFLGLGSLFLAFIGSFFSKDIIKLLFGNEYIESAVILSVLIFYLSFSFFSIPFTNALQATHNEKHLLKICWISPIVNIVLNYIFLLNFGLIGIAYSTLIVTFLSTVFYILLTNKTLKNQNRTI